MQRLKEIILRRETKNPEHAKNLKLLKKLKEDLTRVFEEQFGQYKLNTLLRYSDTQPIRHSVESRPRTIVFDIIDDIKHNFVLANNELACHIGNQQKAVSIFESLVTRLRELLQDHLIEQGKSDRILYNLSRVHQAVEACIQEFETKHLQTEV